ncbi:MAG: thiamine phosphate synthase [Mesorhizobium sp.]
MRLDPFYPIVDSAALVARLVPLGVRLVQLRIKGAAEAGLRAEIRKAKAVCDCYHSTLVVNDHWRLAIEEGCAVVHLGQEDLALADLAAIKRAGLRFGISSHDRAELAAALAVAPDYVALGPIYPTALKPMRCGPQGLERLAEWKSLVGSLPLVAIGGLDPGRLAGVFAHGADSAAAATDIVGSDNPEARTRAWLQATAWRR